MALRRTRLITALLLAVTVVLPAWAQTGPQLTPQKRRITDEALYADHSRYQATQDRIQALNDGGRPLRDYHLSKAQCWLDVSFHEYSRNDRSDFPQAALDESVRLVTGMEQGTPSQATDTPLVNNAAYLRDDLWQRLKALHGTLGFECAAQKAACGEVELVHAGNEFNQQQWRHSKPYIQMAEDLTNQAEALARQCQPQQERPATGQPAQNMVLTANVLFDFDRDSMDQVRPESLRGLNDAWARLQAEKLRLVSVRLIGHADRLQGPGQQYNQALSERRAKAVREFLINKGVPADAISYHWRGDSEQVQTCDGLSGGKLRECLLPNRRVEVKFEVENQQS